MYAVAKYRIVNKLFILLLFVYFVYGCSYRVVIAYLLVYPLFILMLLIYFCLFVDDLSMFIIHTIVITIYHHAQMFFFFFSKFLNGKECSEILKKNRYLEVIPFIVMINEIIGVLKKP